MGSIFADQGGSSVFRECVNPTVEFYPTSRYFGRFPLLSTYIISKFSILFRLPFSFFYLQLYQQSRALPHIEAYERSAKRPRSRAESDQVCFPHSLRPQLCCTFLGAQSSACLVPFSGPVFLLWTVPLLMRTVPRAPVSHLCFTSAHDNVPSGSIGKSCRYSLGASLP